MLSIVGNKLTVLETLTSEVNHRTFIGSLAVLVIFLHLLTIVWLLQPSNSTNEQKPLKIMEVALITEPTPKSETVSAPPPKPSPPKAITPKKKPVKPIIKRKEPVVQKHPELPKLQPLTDAQLPVLPAAANDSVQETPTPVAKPQPTVTKPSVKTGSGENNTVSSGVVALSRVQPKYPMRAANRHIEGWVKIEFTVTSSGTVANATVVAAEPAGIFDEAALDAIVQWKFKQKIVDGKAVNQRAVQVLKFKLTH